MRWAGWRTNHKDGNPGRVPKPSRDELRLAKPASARRDPTPSELLNGVAGPAKLDLPVLNPPRDRRNVESLNRLCSERVRRRGLLDRAGGLLMPTHVHSVVAGFSAVFHRGWCRHSHDGCRCGLQKERIAEWIAEWIFEWIFRRPLVSAAGSAVAAPAAPSNGPGVLGQGIIKGNVHFSGKAPEPKAITTPDPFCARQQIKEEELMVGPGGGLKNVLVRVTKGASGSYEAPKVEAIVDQSGCMYRPRVQAVMAGQTVQIKNSDQTLHNVHTYKGASTIFNQAQIPGMGPMSKTFSDGGQVIKFKCDVHPWMTGYVAVADQSLLRRHPRGRRLHYRPASPRQLHPGSLARTSGYPHRAGDGPRRRRTGQGRLRLRGFLNGEHDGHGD